MSFNERMNFLICYVVLMSAVWLNSDNSEIFHLNRRSSI